MIVKHKKTNNKGKTSIVAWRFYLVFAVVCLIYVGLMARAAYIQVIEPDMLKKQGDMRSLRVSSSESHRGSIVDRNGDELAISVPVETVWADPKIIMQNNALAMVKHWQALADILDRPVAKLTRQIVANPTGRFVYIQRQISPSIANYIKQLKIPGIHLRKEAKRFYPAGEISAQLVGFTNLDDKGVEGIEYVFNDQLTGSKGKQRFRKDAKGRKIEIISENKAAPAQDVTLSIDQRIQAIAYRELKGAVDAFKATSGSAVVTNVHTGEILAIVNSPSYNPNNRKNVSARRFRNRAITDMYEPGSTMKPLTMISAFEFGVADKGTIVDTNPGWMRLGGRRVSDPRNLGKLSLTEILIHSSNMGTTKLALSMPKQFLLDRFFEAGFGEKTGTGLNGESMGMMSDRHRWSPFELATLSWGYGLAITPVQLARLYTTIANGGVKLPLSIVKLSPSEVPKGERVYSPENTHRLMAMLEQVVEKHAPKAKVDGYRVGGKTGTTLKAIAGGYGNDYVGLFAGMAPLSNPQIVVSVVINEPGGDLYHGADVAAPVFSRIMKGALRTLNITPDNVKERVIAANKEGKHQKELSDV